MPRSAARAIPALSTAASLVLSLAGSLAVSVSGAAQAQDFTLEPAFGVMSLGSGFQPDPNWVRILAGGQQRSEYTDQNGGGSCAGYFAEAPDFRVFFEPRSGEPLSFYVESPEDTVLLVNTPDGRWHCNDDYAGLDPALVFEDAAAGQYDIWVGTYSDTGGDYPSATLAMTEAEPFTGMFERAFFGTDDRVEVDPLSAPWSMIGFLDLDSSSCTGVLIGPATVLTAAHCMANDGVIDTPPVEFLAGYDRGRSVARSAAIGYHVPAGWLNGEQDGTDFAFVFLAQPIGDQVGWMDVTGLSADEIAAYETGEGPTILQAGYSYDRDGILTGNLACPFVEIGPSSELVHECDTLQGDSGSPLFVAGPERYRVIGIESHTQSQPREQYDRNVAIYAEAIMSEMHALAEGRTGTPVMAPEIK